MGSMDKELQLLQAYNLNPWSPNPTEWLNTLEQFVGNSRQIVEVHMAIL